MYYIHCLFDGCFPAKPLYAVVYNGDSKEINFYNLFLKNTNYPLFDVYSNLNYIKELFYKEDVVVSSFKNYIYGFNLDINRRYEVYDVNFESKMDHNLDLLNIKKMLIGELKQLTKIELQSWHQIYANAQLPYKMLEDTGFYHNGKKKHPRYEFTYSGRSKCLDNNIQGFNDNDDVEHVDQLNDIFVNFDWVAADFRIVSLLSGDVELIKSFRVSDPYTLMHDTLNVDNFTRNECKLSLFKSLYSMDVDSDILKFYPGFTKWMSKCGQEIRDTGYGESILGRKFYISDDRSIKSVFNASVQGSVAHAMHNVLYKVYKMYPDNILTEVHDSLIMCCNKNNIKAIIDDVSEVMLHPYVDILDDNPTFPLKINIGNRWRKWNLYKEIR